MQKNVQADLLISLAALYYIIFTRRRLKSHEQQGREHIFLIHISVFGVTEEKKNINIYFDTDTGIRFLFLMFYFLLPPTQLFLISFAVCATIMVGKAAALIFLFIYKDNNFSFVLNFLQEDV